MRSTHTRRVKCAARAAKHGIDNESALGTAGCKPRHETVALHRCSFDRLSRQDIHVQRRWRAPCAALLSTPSRDSAAAGHAGSTPEARNGDNGSRQYPPKLLIRRRAKPFIEADTHEMMRSVGERRREGRCCCRRQVCAHRLRKRKAEGGVHAHNMARACHMTIGDNDDKAPNMEA